MAATQPETKPIPTAFVDRLKQLPLDERTEDFTITCEGVDWEVHSQVLLLHSDVFGKIVSGAFKTKDRVLDLSDDGTNCVSKLIDYLYTFDYKAEEAFVGLPLCLHTQLYLAGDKYNIQHLKELALSKLRVCAAERVEAGSGDNFLQDLEEAAHLAWSFGHAAEDVRKVIVDLVLQRQDLLTSADDQSTLEHIMLENGGMAVDLLQAAISRPRKAKREENFRCPRCHVQFTAIMNNAGFHACFTCGISQLAATWRASYMVA